VVAFVSFLTVLKRIGAGRSGYIAAVIPVVAMLASTLFEGYRWSAAALAGLALVLAGTVLVLTVKERAARSASAGR
jgi:drug/metabolite transporter (DMT)-like permease